MRLPHASVLVGAEERPDVVEERQTLFVRKIREPAHRREERDDAFPVERLWILEPNGVQRFERRRLERAAPVAGRVDGSAEVERVVAEIHVWHVLGEQLLDGADRGLGRTGGG